MNEEENIEMRKSPKRKKGQQMVDDILKGANIAIDKFGIKKISSAKISKLTGISVGSFYQYFPNKESVYIKLAKKMSQKLEKQIDIILIDDEISLDTKIEKISSYLVDYYFDMKTQVNYFVKLIISFGQIDFFLEVRERLYVKIAKYLENNTEFNYEKCYRTSYILINSLIGNLLVSIQQKKTQIPQDELKEELAQLMKAILKDKLALVN